MRKYRVVIMIMVFMLILCFTVSCFQIRTISEGNPPQATTSSIVTTLPPPTSTDVSLPPVLVTAPSHCSVPPVTTTPDGEGATVTPETTSEGTTPPSFHKSVSPTTTTTNTATKRTSPTTTETASKQTTTSKSSSTTSITTKTTTTTTKPGTATTTKTTTKSTTKQTGEFIPDYENQVIDLVNAFREENGKAPLTLNTSLRDSARIRAKEIVEKFDHVRPDGTTWFTVITFPYLTAGENIASGHRTPTDVMGAWMGSPDHRANILNDDFTVIGVGCYEAEDGRLYWVQLFAKPQ